MRDPNASWLLPLLALIAKRPGMFLADERVRSLSLYLAVYELARCDLGVQGMAQDDEDFLRAFEVWLVAKHELKRKVGNRGWPGIIELLDDSTANVRTFFRLLEEFLSTMGRSLARMELWPKYSSLRPELEWPIEREALAALERILKEGPAALERVLDETARPLSNGPLYFRGLAEAAASRARDAFERDDEAGLAWSRASVRIYEVLATETANITFELNAMHVRVSAIAHAGTLAGDPIRDPARIADWFRASVHQTVESAVAEPWQTLAELRTLQAIKSRLGVIARLAAVTPLEPDLQRWLSIRDQLP